MARLQKVKQILSENLVPDRAEFGTVYVCKDTQQVWVTALSREVLNLSDLLEGKTATVRTPGPQGAPGRDGVDGSNSTVPGPRGNVGEAGRDGKDSTVPGPKGDKGNRGDKGDKGDDGKDGHFCSRKLCRCGL